MTKLSKCAAAVALAFAGVSAASAANFDGLYVGGGVALNKMTVGVTSKYSEYYYGDTFNEVESDISGDDDHDLGFNLNVGYGMSFGRFNVAIEAAYTSSYGESKPYSYSWNDYSESMKAELTGGKSVSILPGFKISENTLVFGRIGYVEAEGELSWTDSIDGTLKGSKDFSGTIWGIGVKHAITSNLVAVLEYQATEFDAETILSGGDTFSADDYNTWSDTAEPKSTGITLGVQYTF